MRKITLAIFIAFSGLALGQSRENFTLEYNHVSIEYDDGSVQSGRGRNIFIIPHQGYEDVIQITAIGSSVRFSIIENTMFQTRNDKKGYLYREAKIMDSYGSVINLVILNNGEQVLFLFYNNMTITFSVKR